LARSNFTTPSDIFPLAVYRLGRGIPIILPVLAKRSLGLPMFFLSWNRRIWLLNGVYSINGLLMILNYWRQPSPFLFARRAGV
jgi:cytochrome c biogenesis protein CcdA